MQPAKRLQYTPDPNKFDLRVHAWDTQGALTSVNHYRTYIMDGRQYFERPVNSGNLWFENNQPAGRVELTFGPTGKIASKKFDFDAEHKAYTPPLVGAEKLHYELEQSRDRLAAVEAELAAIRKEQQAVQPKPAAVEAPLAQAIGQPTLKRGG